MIYKYIFHSPVRYLIKTNIDNRQYKEVSIDKLKLNREEINQNVNLILNNITKDFIQYMNHQGIQSIKFLIINGNLLKIIVEIDHILPKKEFDSLYIDLQGQLMDELGKKMKSVIIKTYDENIEYVDQGMKKLKSVTKYLYCLLWQYDNWKLKFINNIKENKKW